MTEEKKNIPKLRFPEFKNAPAWEQRKLGELGNTFTGLSGKTKNDFGHGNAKYITYINVFQNVIADYYGTETIEIDAKQNSVQYGDVLFTTSSETPNEVGMSTVWLYDENNVYLNSFCFGYRLNIKFDYYFFGYLLRTPTFRNKMELLAQGISRYNISKIKAMEIGVLFPNLEEQEKIGELFNKIDSHITYHQRKLDKLKERKKALLQRMFPKDGHTAPELRFPGFTDAWEQRKLGEIVNRFDNLRIPITADKRRQGSTPYYGANGIQDYVEGYTHDGEYVLIAEDGASDFINYPIQYVKGKVWVNNHAHVIQGVVGSIDNLFLLYALKTINFQPYLVGGGRSKLTTEELTKISISVPGLNEQSRLGVLFKLFDTHITCQQRMLEHLKLRKKALLQQMFV